MMEKIPRYLMLQECKVFIHYDKANLVADDLHSRYLLVGEVE